MARLCNPGTYVRYVGYLPVPVSNTVWYDLPTVSGTYISTVGTYRTSAGTCTMNIGTVSTVTSVNNISVVAIFVELRN